MKQKRTSIRFLSWSICIIFIMLMLSMIIEPTITPIIMLFFAPWILLFLLISIQFDLLLRTNTYNLLFWILLIICLCSSIIGLGTIIMADSQNVGQITNGIILFFSAVIFLILLILLKKSVKTEKGRSERQRKKLKGDIA